MISAKHQFLDLTIPSNSERKQTGSLFGKVQDAAARSSSSGGGGGSAHKEDKEVRGALVCIVQPRIYLSAL